MFKNYLITAWRNIIKNGVFSVINILGLTIGLMSCILIMLFVRDESGYDQWLPNNEKLVRMHTAFTSPGQQSFLTVRSAGRMMQALKDYASADIEEGVRMIQYNPVIQHKGEIFEESASMVDPSFFNVFELPFVHGDISRSFNKPMDLVVTEEMARKYFGKTDVIGETLTFCCVNDQAATLAITGVIKDLPTNTHLDINFIVYLNPAMFVNDTNVLNTWTSVNVYTYFKLKSAATIESAQERVTYWLNNESPLVEMAKNMLGDKAEGKTVSDFVRLKLMSVPDLHLKAKQDAGNMGDMTAMGDENLIKTFSWVALLVLVIACINFMNLATAKASKRAKEVAMRKVLGASRSQVAFQFLSEAIAIVLLALACALALAEVVLPFYNQVINKELSLVLLDDPKLLISLVLGSTFVGILAGIYPALYLSKFLPGQILKSSKSAESGSSNKLRSSLVVFQFATSITLVIATIVVYGQTLYANSVDVGYTHDRKLVMNARAAAGNLSSLEQQLLNIPGITSVSFSSEAPTQDNENNTTYTLVGTNDLGEKVESQLLNYHNMGYGFFEDYDIKPIAGRVFDEAFGSDAIVPSENGEPGTASIVLNESAVRKFGFSSPEKAIGQVLQSGRLSFNIIGVVPDIHFRSIKFGIRATAYSLNPQRLRIANISYDSQNPAQLIEQIDQVWKQVAPMMPLNIQYLNEMMAAQYEDELTTAKLFLAFSMLAILIACLGLYGLSAFTVERRTKEIGIRKVMGADVGDIVKLLIFQFSKPVLLANVVAWPVSAYLMLNWLEAFPYRIDSWYLIPIALIVMLVSLSIAWLTVGGNAAKVANRNPVLALRYE